MYTTSMPTYTKEQKEQYKAEKREEAKQRLRDSISALKTDEGWQAWLKTRVAFKQYSVHNTLFLAIQTRNWETPATYITGGKTWREKFERVPKEGTKALRLFAPVMVTKKDKDGNIVLDDNGKPIKFPLFFKLVPVFDISQTEGEDVEFEQPKVTIEGNDYMDLLVEVDRYADELGLDFSYDDDASANANVYTAMREIARFHIRKTEIHEDDEIALALSREPLIDAVSYIVLAGLGYDASAESVPRIASYHIADDEDGETEGLKALDRYATYIDKAARKIEKELDI